MYQGAQRGQKGTGFLRSECYLLHFLLARTLKIIFINITVAVYCVSQFSLVMKNGEPGRKPPT